MCPVVIVQACNCKCLRLLIMLAELCSRYRAMLAVWS